MYIFSRKKNIKININFTKFLSLYLFFISFSDGSSPQLGKVMEHSKRQVRGFVGCHAMLEPGCYLVVCLAFNHWHTGNLKKTREIEIPKNIKKIRKTKCLVYVLFRCG